jgi:hypothetical protein
VTRRSQRVAPVAEGRPRGDALIRGADTTR